MDFPYDETIVSLARNYCFTARKLWFLAGENLYFRQVVFFSSHKALSVVKLYVYLHLK